MSALSAWIAVQAGALPDKLKSTPWRQVRQHE